MGSQSRSTPASLRLVAAPRCAACRGQGRRSCCGPRRPPVTDQATEVIRVVIADDHAVVRSGLRAELGAGFSVVGEADDAEGAIDVIEARRPDLVVCDLHMPRGGGLLVVERCATVCPIVILTVSEAERDLLDTVAAG